MGWMDLIPRAPMPLYIGGLYALYQSNLLQQNNITHILSIIDYDFHSIPSSSTHLSSQKSINHHLQIALEDDPNANLLQHFPEICTFIDSAFSPTTIEKNDTTTPGSVFVHCAMGKSRSATGAAAYLMWKTGVGRDAALAQICEGRAVCEPNPGFLEQLEVWERMLGCEEGGEERRKVYDDWVVGRFQGEVNEWEVRAGMRAKL
ncbi:hypothetical protein Q7P37_003257 [Cladosporium fusiforme]